LEARGARHARKGDVVSTLGVGTPLDVWRISEKRLSAIEAEVAEISGHDPLSAAEVGTLARLLRARDAARQSADKCWAALLEDLGHNVPHGPDPAERSDPADSNDSDRRTPPAP